MQAIPGNLVPFNIGYLCPVSNLLGITRSKRRQGSRAYRSPALLVPPGGGAAEVVDRVSKSVERVPQIAQPRPGAGVASLLRLGVHCQAPRLVELPLQPPQLVCGDPAPAFAREERRHRTGRGRQRRGCDHHGCGRAATSARQRLGGNEEELSRPRQ